MKTMFLALTLMSFFATAQSDKVSQALTTKLSGTDFQATLKEGFHFNESAPNQMTIDGKNSKPASMKARELHFQLANEKFSSGHASLYICDDALTFCEPKSVDLKRDTSKAAQAASAAPVQKKVTKNDYGFIEDNLRAATSLATIQKKLVLIDFSARWCPGCIRLENEVFNTKEFKAASKDFVTVRLDYDRFENLKRAKQYNVRAIPTLLVTTVDLEEVSRVVDYQPVSTIKAFLADAKANPLSFAQLQTKADAGDQASALALGQRLYLGNQFAKSVVYLSKAKTPPVELADAKVQAAKEAAKLDEKKKPDFQKALRDAIAAEPSTSRSLLWRTDLVETLSDAQEKKKIGLEGLAVADTILAHPEKMSEATKGDPIGEFAGLEKMYVANERSDLAASAGLDEATQKAALAKVLEAGRELKIPVERKGPALRFLLILIAADQLPEAETQVRAMIKAAPNDPELQRRLLRVLNGEKKFTEAVQVGRDLLPNSFGKNEVWVAQQLAKAYVGAGQKREAKALADSYLARKDIDWSLMTSEQKDLTDLSKSL